MKWLLRVKGKRYKVCALFVMIMVLVLLNNLLERRNVSHLDDSVTSIYHDRLLPATYLFGISNHLHQERMMRYDEVMPAAEKQRLHTQHDAAIHKLMKEYETTHLTPEEGKQWKVFKARLADYNHLPATATPEVLDKHFLRSLETLNSLSDIQVAEGKTLQSNSQTIASDSTISSQLEISLLIILGVAAIVLLLISDKPLLFKDQPPVLN